MRWPFATEGTEIRMPTSNPPSNVTAGLRWDPDKSSVQTLNPNDTTSVLGREKVYNDLVVKAMDAWYGRTSNPAVSDPVFAEELNSIIHELTVNLWLLSSQHILSVAQDTDADRVTDGITGAHSDLTAWTATIFGDASATPLLVVQPDDAADDDEVTVELRDNAGAWTLRYVPGAPASVTAAKLQMNAAHSSDGRVALDVARDGATSVLVVRNPGHSVPTADDITMMFVDGSGADVLSLGSNGNITGVNHPLTITTSVSGDITIDSAAAVDVQAGSTVTINPTSTLALSSATADIDIDAATTIAIDAPGGTTHTGAFDVVGAVDITGTLDVSSTLTAASGWNLSGTAVINSTSIALPTSVTLDAPSDGADTLLVMENSGTQDFELEVRGDIDLNGDLFLQDTLFHSTGEVSVGSGATSPGITFSSASTVTYTLSTAGGGDTILRVDDGDVVASEDVIAERDVLANTTDILGITATLTANGADYADGLHRVQDISVDINTPGGQNILAATDFTVQVVVHTPTATWDVDIGLNGGGAVGSNLDGGTNVLFQTGSTGRADIRAIYENGDGSPTRTATLVITPLNLPGSSPTSITVSIP